MHQCDCIRAMQQMPEASVDVAIADPPYNASKGAAWKWDNSVKLPGFGGEWSKVSQSWDDMSLGDYLAFTWAWVSELKRLVKPTGSLWIHGVYHNIGIINFVLQAQNVEIINEVVWYKRNSFPNLAGRRLTASHETILWAHTGRCGRSGAGKPRRYLFNYQAARTAACPGDRLKAAGKQMRTVWDIPSNKSHEELSCGRHPTQKPLRLLERMLAVSAQPGWLCLAPFAGAGSECVAALRAGLNFLGFETEPAYADIARRRIAQELARSQSTSGTNAPSAGSP